MKEDVPKAADITLYSPFIVSCTRHIPMYFILIEQVLKMTSTSYDSILQTSTLAIQAFSSYSFSSALYFANIQ